MNKRGQIVVFIIIGIIILFAVAAIFFIRSYVVESGVGEQGRQIEELPSEFQPIRTFTDNCIREVGKTALKRLGQQGGYIYPDAWDRLSFDATDPTDSDGILFPGSELKVPYWWYNRLENDQDTIVLFSNQPSLEKMEDDMARFVNLELGNCLDNYESFKPLGFEIAEGTTSAEVSIVSGEVRFYVEHPLEITKDSSEQNIRNFYVTVPVDLMHIYEIADLITESQKNFSFLEKHTLNLIEMFSDVDAGLLPPMEAHSFDTINTLFWTKEKVRQDLKQILSAYTSMFRFINSANYYRYEYPAELEYTELMQRSYDNTILDLQGAEDLEVRFQYLDWWEPYFDVNAEGEIIKPQHLSLSFLGLGFFGIQHYSTLYDLSYPVYVSLTLPQGLDGEDYQFNFALEGNIRTNSPARTDQNLTNAALFDESLFCDLEQRNSGEISVKVIDAYNKEPLENAEVFFSAGDERCSIGMTSANGVLKTKFPIAIGGLLTAGQDGYLTSSQPLDTFLDEPDTLIVGLWQLKEIDVVVRKKKMYNCKLTPDDDTYCFFTSESEPFNTTNPFEALLLEQYTSQEPEFATIFRITDSEIAKRSMWYFENSPTNLGDNETGVFSMERVSMLDSGLTAAGLVEGMNSYTVRLAPGNYTMGAQILAEREYFIPRERRCTLDVLGECAQSSVIASTTLDQMALGGISWENEEDYFEIKPSDLYSANRLVIHALSPAFYDIPEGGRVVEDLQVLSEVSGLSVQFRDELEPVFT